MDSFKQLLKKIKDFVITVDPYDDEEEDFTAEVNQDLLQQIKDKDTEIEELTEIIAQLCYRNMSAINEALSHFNADVYYEEHEDDDTDLEDTKGECLGGLSDTEFQELLTKTK
jgi:hypothetical protein